MESNAPVLSKKVWNMLHALLFMLRKGITKGNIMALNLMLKRRTKIAGKAIANLMFHHAAASHHHFSAPREYEFSCSNTPHNSFQGKRHRHFFACVHAPPTHDDDAVTVNAMKAVLEMLNNNNDVTAASPLPGFGRSPAVVRQLRVTDSPFPLRESDGDGDQQVDKKAEEFIKRFYKDLKKQD
ncbi:uncharacterized protein LOC109809566 [Cajanus cajan]|uniref:Avr9/Cf-9 rapidly elicited protein 146 n=1 Tax=Cajanus cajan TaxID=3821 RepID=A0A151SHD5_CAJCA|nr:uncharacterized protein LOC109809566 [Cajanus cajan]KYP54260.1 hypothetical protein KK1_000441 [Cajanus cajan]